MKVKSLGVGVGTVVALFAVGEIVTVKPVFANDYSFTGTFSTDDDVQLFNFYADNSESVILRSLSYAGGTSANGTVIPEGGFDPILALFDGNGNLIDSIDDGSFPDVEIDPITGYESDVFLKTTLAPGNYTAAISQFDNFFNGSLGDNISEGFSQEGQPNFTSSFGCAAGQFCDFNGTTRTNAWAFDILNVETANIQQVPFEVSKELGTVLFASIVGISHFWRRLKTSKK